MRRHAPQPLAEQRARRPVLRRQRAAAHLQRMMQPVKTRGIFCKIDASVPPVDEKVNASKADHVTGPGQGLHNLQQGLQQPERSRMQRRHSRTQLQERRCGRRRAPCAA